MIIKLTDYIDFKVFSEAVQFDVVDEDSFMKCPKDGTFTCYVDNNIKSINYNEGLSLINSGRKNINKFSKLPDVYLNKHFKNTDKLLYSTFYKSEDHFLFYFAIDHEDFYGLLTVAGLIDINSKKYVLIGTFGEHYFIKHHLFNFCDANGFASCDYGLLSEIINCDNEEIEDIYESLDINPKEICGVLEKIFIVLCSAKYYKK